MSKLSTVLATLTIGACSFFPTPSASALPACGGVWTHPGTECFFEAPAGAFAFGGLALTPDESGTYSVIVQVVVRLGGSDVTLQSCGNSGSAPVTCQGVVQTPFPNYRHVCKVSGAYSGEYRCADPPFPVG